MTGTGTAWPYRVLRPALAAGLLAGGLGGCAPAVSVPVTRPQAEPARQSATTTPRVAATSVTGGPGTAIDALATLAVKGRAAKTGYSREAFGQAWADEDRNGCDTRNDILNRDLADRTHKPGTAGCAVLTGTLADPYTARTIAFRRGATTSSAVQIDHVVALSNAWQTGAASFDAATRRRLANDPVELLAVDGPSNQAKSDADAATWLPPSKAYRCAYVARQVAVKAKYRLWVTPAEKAAITRILSTCPDQPLVTSATTPGPLTAASQSPGEPASPTAPAPAPNASPEVSYPNCAVARAAGVAPLKRGAPGYSSRLDRDGDGVACE